MMQLDRQSRTAVQLLEANVEKFASIEEAGDAFARCFGNFGSCKIILIGDASHGTSEFYKARTEITKYMIQNHGFTIVAAEADWPDAEVIDRYVRYRRRPQARSRDGQPSDEEEPAFTRFPTWMWRNLEVQDFVEWLRKFNKGAPVHDAVGFYGLDLYSLRTSMQAVIRYLDSVDKEMGDLARERYEHLMDWAEHPHEYGLKALISEFEGYEREVVDMLSRLLSKRLEYSALHWDGEEFHSGEQNARLVKGKVYKAAMIMRFPLFKPY
jgi:erythromycin esterase-like protein